VVGSVDRADISRNTMTYGMNLQFGVTFLLHTIIRFATLHHSYQFNLKQDVPFASSRKERTNHR